MVGLLFRELGEGRKERGDLSMEEFYCFHTWAPSSAGGRGVHIFPPGQRLHRGFKRFLFRRFTGKSEGKETETLLKMAPTGAAVG